MIYPNFSGWNVMNTFTNKMPSALIIAPDQVVYMELIECLDQPFQFEYMCFREDEVRKSLIYDRPKFVLWDARQPTDQWQKVIRWLRDYYHGIPILAVVNGEDREFLSQLAGVGVNQIIQYNEPNMKEYLQLTILAVLLDLEQVEMRSAPSEN